MARTQDMAPVEIETLLHFHGCIEKLPRGDAPAVNDAVTMLYQQGLIEPAPTIPALYVATDLGKAMVKMLCETPLPKRVIIDPRHLDRFIG